MTFFFLKKKALHFHLRTLRTCFLPFFCLQLFFILVVNSHMQLLQIHGATSSAFFMALTLNFP